MAPVADERKGNIDQQESADVGAERGVGGKPGVDLLAGLVHQRLQAVNGLAQVVKIAFQIGINIVDNGVETLGPVMVDHHKLNAPGQQRDDDPHAQAG